MAKRRAKQLIGGVGLGAILALYIVGYHQSKACTSYGNQFLAFLFAPYLIGLVVGAILPDSLEGKFACALGISGAAIVIAFFVQIEGDFAGTCGVG